MRVALLLLASFCWAATLCAQDTTDYVTPPPPEPKKEERLPFKDRLWFGGNIGLNIGTYATSIMLNPVVGVYMDGKKKFSLGLGPYYSYFNYKGDQYYLPYEESIFGYSAFARYRILQPIYVQAEFLHLNRKLFNRNTQAYERVWIPHMLVGGGYIQQLGNSFVSIQLMYEVLGNPNSIYINQGAIISVGGGIGF